MKTIIIEKYAIPLSILISCIILGGLFFIVQIKKQNYIEEQSRIERINQFSKELDLKKCISDAEDKYWENMKLNGTENKDGTITAPQYKWDNEEKQKQSTINNCYKQYK